MMAKKPTPAMKPKKSKQPKKDPSQVPQNRGKVKPEKWKPEAQ